MAFGVSARGCSRAAVVSGRCREPSGTGCTGAGASGVSLKPSGSWSAVRLGSPDLPNAACFCAQRTVATNSAAPAGWPARRADARCRIRAICSRTTASAALRAMRSVSEHIRSRSVVSANPTTSSTCSRRDAVRSADASRSELRVVMATPWIAGPNPTAGPRSETWLSVQYDPEGCGQIEVAQFCRSGCAGLLLGRRVGTAKARRSSRVTRDGWRGEESGRAGPTKPKPCANSTAAVDWSCQPR